MAKSRPLGPWEGIKRSNSQFQRFLYVLTNERYKTYQTGFYFCCLGHAPGVRLSGAGGAEGGQILFLSNMVMWHIKSTGMTSKTECK